MRTEVPSKHDIVRAWHVIDANDAVSWAGSPVMPLCS